MNEQKNNIFIISGPSGVGKTTIAYKLLSIHPNLEKSISFTSRPIRENEVDGIDYHFIDDELFRKKIANDEFVEIALQFLQRDGSAPHAPALEYTLSAQQKTAIQGARRIHNCNGTGKWALQAWLLTGDSPESISGETAIPLEEITWYARLFFDVEDRLHNRSFITHHVIGPKIHYGLSVEDVDVIWRFWAYNGGPRVLEALLDDFFEADMPDYRYLFDGTFRNADLPRTRLILQQALRVQLMSAEDVLRMLSAALKDPATTARAKTLDDLVESLAMPEMGCDSASPGDEPGAPTEDLQGISAGEADVVEVA